MFWVRAVLIGVQVLPVCKHMCSVVTSSVFAVTLWNTDDCEQLGPATLVMKSEGNLTDVFVHRACFPK